MNQTHPQKRKLRRALALALLPSLAVGSYAQQPSPSASAEGDTVKMEKFVVTGSYIPVAAGEPANPVTTISAASIADSGVSSSLLEVLRKTMPQFTGGLNLGSSNADISSGSTGGGSSVALRNTQTLVLINGRRAAYAPILASGGLQFVDLNLIPIAAVERVEVLHDGASALYGTDAVAGVVNIILKKDFNGFEANARYAFSDEKGHYSERKFSLVGGASTGKTTVTIGGEWAKTDPLFQYERRYSAESYGTPTFAGVITDDSTGQFYVLKPGLNAPPLNQNLTLAQLVANGTYIPVDGSNLASGLGTEKQYAFNLANYVTLLLGNERSSALVNFEHRFTDSVTLFGDFLYTQTNTYSQLNAQPLSSSRSAADPTNPSDVALRARNRFTAYPRQYFYDSTSMRGVVGLRGSLSNGYTWEIAADKNRIDQSYRNQNVVNTAARLAAVAAGTINMFAREQAPGAIESSGMFGTAFGFATSTIENYDGRLTGKLMDLPAGELGFAVGAEHRVESLVQNSDVYSQSATFGWDSATTLDPLNTSRSVNSAFVDVRVPIFGGNYTAPGFHLLELEGALRTEKYSDTDDPTVPKVTLRWLPFSDEFALRGTYSESFAAPTLFQMFGPTGSGSTPSLALDRFGGGAPITGQANQQNPANPNLKPTTSHNYTLGLVYSPRAVKGFSMSVDYFSIDQKDLVGLYGATLILQDVELNGTASRFANRVRFGPADDFSQFTNGAPVTAAGQIGNRPIDTVYVRDPYENISTVKLSGLDLKFDYTWKMDTLGQLGLTLAASYFDKYEFEAYPGGGFSETAGYASTFNGTIPKWQTILSGNWSRGQWGATFSWQHIPSVDDQNAYDETDPGADTYVEPFDSIDLGVSYTFGREARWFNGLSLRVGANNVFDTQPSVAKGTFGNGNADIATYGAVGRLIFVEARYKF
ncbi:TonB-dependent receptor domain-containing protein [Oleiharenicola sp. Vm1]|uniref:TonB-dependent receptor domain-containing protein n=1 Tax=Oleiharenicola sp. Vm1 TaxID=3398393 RepID=UPI0039F634D4